LPKDQGGLGIINLRTQNAAVLLKYLHKFYNDENIPWVFLTWQCLYSGQIAPHVKRSVGSFWWMDVMTFSDRYFMIVSCQAAKGSIVCFWTDTWNLGVLKWQFPPALFICQEQEHIPEKNLFHRMLTPTFSPHFLGKLLISGRNYQICF
jgi:hypothetical protein